MSVKNVTPSRAAFFIYRRFRSYLGTNCHVTLLIAQIRTSIVLN